MLAIATGVQPLPTSSPSTPNFSTLGLGLQDIPGIFTIEAGVLAAVLAIFTIMLSDFFDTMGTVTGIAAEAGLAEGGRHRARRRARAAGRRPGGRRRWRGRRQLEHHVHRERGRAWGTADERA